MSGLHKSEDLGNQTLQPSSSALQTPQLLTSKSADNVVNSGETDCDCACPNAPFTITTTNLLDTTFSTWPETYTVSLRQGYQLAFSPFAPAGPSVLNPAAWQRYQTFHQQAQPLKETIDHELVQQNLLIPTGHQPQIQPTAPDQLTAWLHVTNACNLDCPYCYVRKSSAHMSLETGLETVDNLFTAACRQGFSRIKLKYAGGEATLHFSLVQTLHERAMALAQKTGLELREVVLSNGVTLTSTMLNWFESTQVRLMVSLDGLGAVHDRQRPRKGGGASFEQVMHTLENLVQPRQIDLHLSVTVTGASAPYLADLVQWILDHNWPFSLNFYRQTPLSADRQDFELEQQIIIEGMQAAYRVIEQTIDQATVQNLPSRPLVNGLLDKVQSQAHTHTCGVGQTYAVVTHTGQVAQCQMHLDQPISDHLDAHQLLPTLAHGPIQNLSVQEKPECQTCTYRYRCTGGCPVETFRVTGRWDVKSPNCTIYQTLYPELLRLEGLRLLKCHGY
ncbi:SPASM domain-containing protein [Leptolyngbyaceae cyanobacterium CCMR0082]|uniref:SPASM domain-containing protein n=1 Tax=Adonisia turfae CCMR0082 TaxID=2304604 RepID=A0A6M0SBM7_9CYAN|nr:SPASM domain-containing protein [Adonisia turfae CCMR0082]